MKDSPKYTYKLRPGHASAHLLIEFGTLEDPEYFLFEILRMLGLAGFESQEMLNLWVNDEITVHLTSPYGIVTVSLAISGKLFIVGNKNQTDILRIDKLLLKSEAFTKEEVDFTHYKIGSRQ